MMKMETALELLQKFNDQNYEAYIVGGAVRDLLMDREIKDIDVTTNALPDQIIEFAKSNNLKYIETGIQHGTVTIIFKDLPVEVTTFRVDTNCDGRHCDVKFVKTLREDLSRRDFTINAIAIDKDLKFYDYFDGQEDILHEFIIAVGNPFDRYREDKLRALRAIRFATVLDFTFNYSTYEAIKSVDLSTISKERIRDELTKILLSNNRIKGIEELSETGLLVQILPEVVELSGIDQDEIHHPEKDVYVHTMLALDSISYDENPSLELILSILLHDIGKPPTRVCTFENDILEIHFYEHEKVGAEITKDILTRLKFPLYTIEKVTWLVANHMRIHHFSEMKKSKKVKLIEHEYFTDLFKLSIADIKGSGVLNLKEDDFDNADEINKFIKDYEIEKQNRPALTQKLINGYDVMNLGLTKKDGVKIGKILELVNDAVIEGKINSREEALEFVKELINNESL